MIIDVFSAALIALLTASLTALVIVIVFVIIRRFDKVEISLISGWNSLVNKLIGDVDTLTSRVKELEEKVNTTDRHLVWVTSALDYLCKQVLSDYPQAVENARRISRGESITTE